MKTGQPPPATQPLAPASGGARRRWPWWFPWLAAGGVSLLGLGGLEVGLRLAGYGHPTSFFLETRRDGQVRLRENPRFGWRFMPSALARAPLPLDFAREKEPGVVRVFVFGESAAQGDPEPAFGFARVLEVLLEARFPRQRFEVINLAVTAINSHLIRYIAQEAQALDGDFWVLYMGNNEVAGPFGPGTVLGRQLPNAAWLRLALAVKATRTGQLLEQAGRRLAGDPARNRTWGGMEMFLEQQVRADDPRLKAVYARWADNLEAVVRCGLRGKARVLVSTLVSNDKDCAPFGSQLAPGLSAHAQEQWRQWFRAGQRAEAAGQTHEALTAYQQAAQLDPTHAELQFRLGQCRWTLGQLEQARRDLVQAREWDTLRFRADARLNQIIAQVATAHQADGVQMVDAARVFAEQSPQGLAGDEFLFEHVHFRFEGNYLLAQLLAAQIAKGLAPAGAGAAPGAILQPGECAQRLGLTPWARYWMLEGMRARLRQPPFSQQAHQPEREQRLQAEAAQWRSGIQRSAFEPQAKVWRETIERRPEDWWLRDQYGKFLEAFGDPAGAAVQWRRVTKLMPHYATGHFELGNVLNRGQTRAEAVQHLEAALRMKPDFPQALNSLGLALAHLDREPEAARLFARALTVSPDFAEAHLNWASLLAKQGRTNEAAAHLADAVRAQPTHPRAQYLWGLDLELRGQLTEAETALAEAVRLRPEFAPAHLSYGRVLARQAKYPAAVQQFQWALRLDPTNQLAREYLRKAEDQRPPP